MEIIIDLKKEFKVMIIKMLNELRRMNTGIILTKI